MDLTLAKEAFHLSNWRWMAGMKVLAPSDSSFWEDWYGDRIVHVSGDILTINSAPEWNDYLVELTIGNDCVLYPDLDDPATLGCLLSLVREAWKDNTISTVCSYSPDMGGDWSVSSRRGRVSSLIKRCSTEKEVLVAALKAASECN